MNDDTQQSSQQAKNRHGLDENKSLVHEMRSLEEEYRPNSKSTDLPLGQLEIEFHKRNFLSVLRHVLTNETQLAHVITWMHNGISFKVHQPSLFEKIVCPVFFQGASFVEFYEILRNIGFNANQTSAGSGIIFAHEDFRRDPGTEDFADSYVNRQKRHKSSSSPVSFLSNPPQVHVKESVDREPISADNKIETNTSCPKNQRNFPMREYFRSLFDSMLEIEREAESEHMRKNLQYSEAATRSVKQRMDDDSIVTGKASSINSTDSNPLDILASASMSSKS